MKKTIHYVINKSSYLQRNIILIFLDVFLFFSVILVSNFIIHPLENVSLLIVNNFLFFSFFCIIQLLVLYLFNVYAFFWRYNTLKGIYKIFKAVLLVGGGMTIFAYFKNIEMFRVFIVNSFLLFNVLIGSRILLRYVRQSIVKGKGGDKSIPSKNILIFGAGDAGEMLSRELSKKNRYKIKGFLDDDKKKKGQMIHSYKVLGTCSDLHEFTERYDIDQVIIGMPSANGEKIKELVAICERSKVTCLVTPGLHEIVDGKVTVNQLREVNINDLLRRNIIDTETEEFASYIRNQSILVTGAGGSIGSEIARQLVKFGAKKIILLDHSEFLLFEIHRKLLLLNSECELIPAVADIKNKDRVEAIMKSYEPDVLFHAAAYKHVPLMEDHVQEAILNNVLGVNNLIELADQCDVKRFVLISTDKAVNPANVMGATKRIGEILMQAKCKTSKTKFCAVRFGNVLDSHGSVVPLFKEQIKNGGPVTVTDPNMTRYFMTIPEAVRLVLHAGSFGNNREIFILDMGNPIRILDLAKDMIRLSGLKEKEDIHIKYTGLRPGEKLEESLYYEKKYVSPTTHPKILLSQTINVDSEKFESNISKLILNANLKYENNDNSIVLRKELFDLVDWCLPQKHV